MRRRQCRRVFSLFLRTFLTYNCSYGKMKHFISGGRTVAAILLALAFASPCLSATGDDDWDRMIRLNSIAEKNGIYKMPAPGDTASVYISEVSVKCGNSAPHAIYSAKANPHREYVIISKESPAVKPGEKITLRFSFTGGTDGLAAFAYADMDMDGEFEKLIARQKQMKDSFCVTAKIPDKTPQGKIRIRLRYTSDRNAAGADAPLERGKCYDIVIFAVGGES